MDSTLSTQTTPWSGIDTDAWAWADGAACAESTDNVFYGPDGGESNEERFTRTAQAKRICFSCPIRVTCLEHAIATGEEFGIWGGKTPAERRELIQRRFSDLTTAQRQHVAFRLEGHSAKEAALRFGISVAGHSHLVTGAARRAGYDTSQAMLDQARTFGVQL